MTQYKLGKLAATRPYGLSDLSVYASGKLPTPPADVNYSTGLSLPIDGNAVYGDCVMAAVAHLIAAWNSETKEHEFTPNQTQVVEEYFVLTGGADTGLNESTTLKRWYQEGIFGHKIAGYAPVSTSDITAIHQMIYFYGGGMFGIQCPRSAQEQFQKGEPWSVVPGSPIEGGHAIAPLGYSPEYIYCATWGGVAAVTYPFLAKYLDEAWAILSNQFVEAGRGPSLDLTTLQADLAMV
jgi:hypothetical protein